MATHQDRRTQPRRRDRIALEFNYAQQRCSVNTMNVSRAGALIRTPVAFPSGTLLILEVPSLCANDCNLRLLARVVRASQHSGDPGSNYSGLGLVWVRAYSSDGPATLRRFLVEILGYRDDEELAFDTAVSGDAVFDFPARYAEEPSPAVSVGSPSLDIQEHKERRVRFLTSLRGRFEVDRPVVYSVNNMHYRGTVMAISDQGIAIRSRGALPFPGAKVVVRYPLSDEDTAPRVLLFALSEMTLEPYQNEAGFFGARLRKVDEMGHRGIFDSHLRNLASLGTRRW